jgi:DNA ligase-4
MTAKAKFEKEIDEAFFGLSKAISTNGGRIVDLDDPKLTHVVMDKRDDSRRVELIRRTCQPKRRQVVISEYIQACLDEGTLLDEEGFVP